MPSKQRFGVLFVFLFCFFEENNICTGTSKQFSELKWNQTRSVEMTIMLLTFDDDYDYDYDHDLANEP